MEWLAIVGAGFLFGLSIAAPVGPIGLLCIRRTLVQGFRFGLVSGIGAACADTVYGVISCLGVGALSDYLVHYQLGLHILGGLLLCYLGIRALLKPSRASQAKETEEAGLWWSFFSTFLLTVSNPMTILSFLAITAAMGTVTLTDSMFLVFGVFAGSTAWWLALSCLLHVARDKVNDVFKARVSLASNVLILLIGLYNIVTVL